MNAIEMRGIKGVMLTTLMSFITPVVIMGQDLPRNFVREILLCEPDTAIGNTQLQARSTTTFYDGLGRPIQLVKDNAAADSSDIVEMTNYDSYGRERFVWLPTAIHGRESQDLPFSPNTIPDFVPLVSCFYDNYEHWTRFSGMNHLPIDSDYPAGLTDASGLLTGKVVWDKDQYVVSATSYDKDFREVLTCETNYDHTYYLSTFCKFDFVGNMIPSQGIAGEILRPIDITGSLPFSESFAYNADGSPTVIARGDNSKNQVQYITISYDGTQIAAMHEDKQVEGLYPKIPSIAKGDYTTGWTYDANGNRTSAPSRGIVSMEYNERNQPTRITFTDGSHIDNYYRSDGTFSGHTDYERTISTVNSGTGTQSTFSRSETNYVGDFVLKGYMPVKYYFDGGYIDIDYNTRATSYNYYIHDWQGSARAVFDDAGALVQAADYSAYGVPSSRYGSFSSDNRLHLGLEWQPMKGIYGYYNNARFRDAILAGSFYQCDPLAEKYYSLSPYSWCSGNPMKFIDPSGKVLKFAKGSSPEFMRYFFEALSYMIENGTADNIFDIMNSKNVYQIKETTGSVTQGNRFESETSTIFWNPLQGLCTTNNNCLSPTTMLDHEAQHCVNYNNNPQKFLNDLNSKDNNYGSIEEKNVIENRETQTAIKQGEIKNEKHSRDDHYGDTFITNDPTKNYEYPSMYFFFHIMQCR